MKKIEPKIRHLWSILAKDVSVDQNTNTISIFSVLEEIQVKLSDVQKEELKEKKSTVLKFVPEISLVSMIHNPSRLQNSQKVELEDSKGSKVWKFEIEEISREYDRMRLILNVQSINYTGAGEYWFKFYTKQDQGRWQKSLELPLVIAEKD